MRCIRVPTSYHTSFFIVFLLITTPPKVKARVLDSILVKIHSKEDLKYASLGLKLFKTQGIDLQKKTATLFIKARLRSRHT